MEHAGSAYRSTKALLDEAEDRGFDAGFDVGMERRAQLDIDLLERLGFVTAAEKLRAAVLVKAEQQLNAAEPHSKET